MKKEEFKNMIFYNRENNRWCLIGGTKNIGEFEKILKRIFKNKQKMNNKTITRSKAVELMRGSKGKFFTVSFMKKDNSERTINGRIKVTKNSKGGKNPATDLGYLSVFSMKDKGYRNVNSQTLRSLKIDGQSYNVR